MLIKTEQEFLAVMNKQVLVPLLRRISNEVVKKLRNNLASAEISTRTLQEYTTFSIEGTDKGYSSTIFINDEALERGENESGNRWGGFNRFMSLDMETSYGGETIAWHMVNWLEQGSKNLPHSTRYASSPIYIGNQPIKKVGMFEKTYKELETQLPQMIETELQSMGLKATKF